MRCLRVSGYLKNKKISLSSKRPRQIPLTRCASHYLSSKQINFKPYSHFQYQLTLHGRKASIDKLKGQNLIFVTLTEFYKYVMTKYLLSTLLGILFLSSCNILQKSAKQELTDGFYQKIAENKKQKVYVDLVGDSILIYPTIIYQDIVTIDTARAVENQSSTPQNTEEVEFILTQHSFDVDFLVVPAKLRFPTMNVPAQLNSEINGSLFLGYRTDRYYIKNTPNSLNLKEQRISHLGYSAGFFTGVGNTFISPTTTNDRLLQEYDGIVWSKGIAIIIGLNNFSVGAALGFDNLLDSNSTIWIYENKPWIGVAFGLNLN